jgi:hypothetical protein
MRYSPRVPHLHADIDESAWSTLYSTVSRPFAPPETGRILPTFGGSICPGP